MILCVDDEPTGLMVRKALLERQGYEVMTAMSGPESLRLFMAYPVEAVVLDYAMPGMNGDQVAAAMKQLKPEIKILLLSAYVDLPEEALKWVDRRAVKGVSPTSFLEELQQPVPGVRALHPSRCRRRPFWKNFSNCYRVKVSCQRRFARSP